MWKNRKGFEMALGTVITIIMMLLVLIVIAQYFLGGTETALAPMTDVTDSSVTELDKAIEGLGMI